MGFQIRENLTQAQKNRRALEYKNWLTENGYVTDHSKTLLEVRSLLQTLTKDLTNTQQDNAAIVKLAAHIEELIQTL